MGPALAGSETWDSGVPTRSYLLRSRQSLLGLAMFETWESVPLPRFGKRQTWGTHGETRVKI